MKRGDVVPVALRGDFGKPRPAVVVQTDRIADSGSTIVCLITSRLRSGLSVRRVDVAPTAENGLRKPSQIMVEKLNIVLNTKCGAAMGISMNGRWIGSTRRWHLSWGCSTSGNSARRARELALPDRRLPRNRQDRRQSAGDPRRPHRASTRSRPGLSFVTGFPGLTLYPSGLRETRTTNWSTATPASEPRLPKPR